MNLSPPDQESVRVIATALDKESTHIKTPEDLEKYQKIMMILNKQIEKEERVIIMRAVGLGAGHWYTCSKDHIYSIGRR